MLGSCCNRAQRLLHDGPVLSLTWFRDEHNRDEGIAVTGPRASQKGLLYCMGWGECCNGAVVSPRFAYFICQGRGVTWPRDGRMRGACAFPNAV